MCCNYPLEFEGPGPTPEERRRGLREMYAILRASSKDGTIVIGVDYTEEATDDAVAKSRAGNIVRSGQFTASGRPVRTKNSA